MTTDKLLVEHVALAIGRVIACGEVQPVKNWAKAAEAAIDAMQSYKQSYKQSDNWFSTNNKDGGCQMLYKKIDGFCAVCGSPNRSCQPEKHPSKTS